MLFGRYVLLLCEILPHELINKTVQYLAEEFDCSWLSRSSSGSTSRMLSTTVRKFSVSWKRRNTGYNNFLVLSPFTDIPILSLSDRLGELLEDGHSDDNL